MSTAHQSPQQSLPPLRVKTINTTTWGSTPSALTITDRYISTNSVVVAYVTGSTPSNGRWAYAVTAGQVVITSSDAESSTLPISYIVL